MEDAPVTTMTDIEASLILCIIGVLLFLFPEPLQRFAVWETRLLPKWLRVFPPETYERTWVRRYIQAVGLGAIIIAFLILKAAAEEYATGRRVSVVPRLFGL